MPSLLLVGLGFALEALAAQSWLAEHELSAHALAYHGGAACAVGLACHYQWRRSQARLVWLMAATLWTLAPVAGAVVAAVFLVGLRRAPRRSLNVDDATQAPRPRLADEIAAELVEVRGGVSELGSLENAMNVQSYFEIFEGTDVDAKIQIARNLRQIRSTSAVKLLKLGQKDRSYHVSYLCTTALTAIEQRWLDEIRILETEATTDPKRMDLRFEAMVQYLAICDSGLVPDILVATYLNRALTHATICLDIAGTSDVVAYNAGKICLRLGRYEEALGHFTAAVRLNPDELGYLHWGAEALFHLRRYREVGTWMRRLKDADRQGLRKEATDFWVSVANV